MAYHRSYSVEIRFERAVGLELTVVPFSFSFDLVEPLAIFVVGIIYDVLAIFGKPLCYRIGKCKLSPTPLA